MLTEELLARLDVALGRGLDEAAARGVQPSCRSGCAHCCHHGVQTSRAEAELLVAHVQQHFTEAERASAEQRVLAYVDWLAVQERLLGPDERIEDRASRLGPVCPFLSDEHRCTAYAARPLVCRTHFVTSPPERCLPPERGGPASGPGARVMHELCEAAVPFFSELRQLPDGSRDVELLLLPEAYADVAGLRRR
jgi:Fe-S-cluster containining protein